jgi:hypothetical protein
MASGSVEKTTVAGQIERRILLLPLDERKTQLN